MIRAERCLEPEVAQVNARGLDASSNNVAVALKKDIRYDRISRTTNTRCVPLALEDQHHFSRRCAHAVFNAVSYTTLQLLFLSLISDLNSRPTTVEILNISCSVS